MNSPDTRLPPAEYVATVKPRFAPTGSKSRPGVVLVLTPTNETQTDHVFYFSSWSFLRERLRVFGFATPEELDTTDVRLYTGKQPYLFSSRRWEAPLIDALDLSTHLP
jgi:hypothetical protein